MILFLSYERNKFKMTKDLILIRVKNEQFYISKKQLKLTVKGIRQAPRKSIKIYRSDECVICLNEKPDICFIPCGHLCVHKKCHPIDQKCCYLCRKQIISLELR